MQYEEHGLMDRHSPTCCARFSTKFVLLCFLVWNVLLFILAVVALSRKPTISTTTVENNFPTITSSFVSYFIGPPGLQTGHTVSTDINGNLMLGAGLSIYLNGSVLDSQEQMNHLEIATLSSNSVVAAFKTASSIKLVMGFVEGVQVYWNTPISLPLTSLDSIVALTPTMMIVVASPYVMAVSLNSKGVLTPGQSFIFAHGDSVNPEIAALSPTTFALSYYQPSGNDINLLTTVGTVDTTSLHITFATPVTYAGDKASHGVLPLTSTSYLLIYPDLTPIYPPTQIGAPLVAQLVTYFANNTIYLPPITAFLNDSLANYFFATARLTSSTGVVLFVDAAHNNALQLVTIELDYADVQIGVGSLAFGASIPINTGDASRATHSGLWMFIDLIALDSSRFVAAYSDLADVGRVVTTVCELTPSHDLVVTSPTFTLSGANPNQDQDYYWVSSTAISSSQFIVMDSLYGSTGVTGAKVAFAEFKASPLGVVTQLSSTGAWEIAVSGFVNVSIPLVKGRNYFATSQGDLVTDDGTSDFLLFPRPGQYITTRENVLVSVDSFVGVAVTENTILLKL